jgi:hypothetical protein
MNPSIGGAGPSGLGHGGLRRSEFAEKVGRAPAAEFWDRDSTIREEWRAFNRGLKIAGFPQRSRLRVLVPPDKGAKGGLAWASSMARWVSFLPVERGSCDKYIDIFAAGIVNGIYIYIIKCECWSGLGSLQIRGTAGGTLVPDAPR